MDFEKKMKRMLYMFITICFMLSMFALTGGSIVKIKHDRQTIKIKQIMKILPPSEFERR